MKGEPELRVIIISLCLILFAEMLSHCDAYADNATIKSEAVDAK